MIERLLFLTEQYCDANPASGPTNAESMVVDALRSTGLVKHTKHFYYDGLSQRYGIPGMVGYLLEDIEVFKPQAIIYTPMGGLLGHQLNPPGHILNLIRSQGVKVYTHFWDTVGREEEIRSNFPFCDLAGDVASDARRFNDPKMIQVWSAINPREFCDKRMKRDIDVCFVGSVDMTGRWPHRITHINYMKNRGGIPVHVRGGQRADRLEWGQYAEILNRSKISLNLNREPGSNTSQLKGRVFETLACGAMLLEDDGCETQKFFAPGVDFVMFDSLDKMVEKAVYYLSHPAEREAIARAGMRKLEEQYSAEVMWKMILDRLTKTPDFVPSINTPPVLSKEA